MLSEDLVVEGQGVDDRGRPRVGPRDRFDWGDRLWPRLHGKWWNYDSERGVTKSVEELYDGLCCADEETAVATLDHVQAISETAVDRAAAADRRAATIAGTVAIAASFTLGGAGLALDESNLWSTTTRVMFAAVLLVTTVAFVISATYALRALAGSRVWQWSLPTDLPLDHTEPRAKQLGMRAAHLLEDFAYNWEISDLKNRNVDNALRSLLVGLAGIAALALIVLIAVA